MSVEAIVFDLFHTVVDPEDFRPQDYHRVTLAARICGMKSRGFADFWKQTGHERNTTPDPTGVWICRYAEQVGVEVGPAALAQADEILGRY